MALLLSKVLSTTLMNRLSDGYWTKKLSETSVDWNVPEKNAYLFLIVYCSQYYAIHHLGLLESFALFTQSCYLVTIIFYNVTMFLPAS